MSQTSFLRSSAIRITLVYATLFALSVSIIVGFLYWTTIKYKTDQTNEDINAEIKILSGIYIQRGYPGLVRALNERIAQQRPGDSTLYLLTNNRFERIVGNIDRWPKMATDVEGQWIDFKIDATFDDTNRQFTARARTFAVEENGFNLLVGQGMKDLATLKSIMQRSLLWGLLLTAVLGIIGGLMMRQSLRSRLSSINQISSKIMAGDLRKRIPTRSTGDEFDDLAINLNKMLDQIEYGMEGVRRVSDNIAHDLKTPLARLKNRVEELRIKVADDEDKSAQVDQIIQEADGLLATFNALLRIARIEYSEQRQSFKELDVNSILSDLLELYEPLSEEKGQSLTMETAKPVMVMADRDMLFQAFANLLDNAIKYTPEKGSVQIRTYREARQWHIEICDNGPGIPSKEHEKVLQRFYRLDQSRTTPGSGLGLSLVFAVLKLHEMNLSFADNNPGLRVRVTMPQQSLAKSNRILGQ